VMPGRCTLMATSSPVPFSVALYTWPARRVIESNLRTEIGA
jgi:hypothetical protein